MLPIFESFDIGFYNLFQSLCCAQDQLRQPQDPESIARGKNLLVIIPIIFARQHFCYFYYTCMSS